MLKTLSLCGRTTIANTKHDHSWEKYSSPMSFVDIDVQQKTCEITEGAF